MTVKGPRGRLLLISLSHDGAVAAPSQIETPDELDGRHLLLEAWDSDVLIDDLVGAFELDLAWVWEQERHEIQQTWVALGDTRNELQRGEVQGYLLVSVSIVPAGLELNTVMPKHNTPGDSADVTAALLPPSIELKCQQLHVKVFYAEDVIGAKSAFKSAPFLH
jgi:hypothetical protein